MNMNIDLKDIPAKLSAALEWFKKYIMFISIMLVLVMYGLLVLRIRQLSTIEPTQRDVNTKLQELQAPRLDEDALDKIEQLQSQSVQVKSLFNKNRNNPFQE